MLDLFDSLGKASQVGFAVLIGVCVVGFWRGAWGLMDLYLFPGDQALSLWASLLGSLVVLVSTHYATDELA